MPIAFSHATDYVLDSAVENQELTADVPAFLRACVPGDKGVERLMELPKARRTDLRPNETDTQWLCRKLTAYTDTLIEKLGPQQDPKLMQDIWLMGMFRAAGQARSVAKHLAYCGALELTSWGDHRPRKTWIHRARSLRHQRRFMQQNELAVHFVPLLHRVVRMGERYKPSVSLFGEQGTEYRFNALRARFEYYGALVRPNEQRVNLRKAGPTPEQRAAVRRAIGLARTIVGEHALHSFLKGDTVHVLGTDFGFAVKKQNLFRLGHGAIGITLCTHELEPLADLCMYFDQTPAIDQLVALRLHCDAGMDADILYDANVMREYPAAASHAGYQAVREIKQEDARTRTAIIGAVEPGFNRLNAIMAGEIFATTNTTSARWITVSSTQTNGVNIDGTTRSNYLLRAFGDHVFTVTNSGPRIVSTATPVAQISSTAVASGVLTVNSTSSLRVERLTDGQLRIFIPDSQPAARSDFLIEHDRSLKYGLQYRCPDTGQRYYGNLAYEVWSEDWHERSGLSRAYSERLAEAVSPNSRSARALLELMLTEPEKDEDRPQVSRREQYAGPAAAQRQQNLALEALACPL